MNITKLFRRSGELGNYKYELIAGSFNFDDEWPPITIPDDNGSFRTFRTKM